MAVTRRKHRVPRVLGAGIPPEAGPESCHAAPRASVVSSGGARRGSLPRSSAAKAGAHFLPSGYKFYMSITRVALAPLLQIKSGGTSLIDSHEFIPGYKFGGGHWRSIAVQTVSKPEIYHDAGFELRADARFAHRSGAKVGVRVQEPLQICLECRSKSKNRDNLSRFFIEKAGNNLPILSVL